MAGNITIRTLTTKLVLQGFREAVAGLKKYRDDLNITAKASEVAAAVIEKSAARMTSALAGAAGGAAAAARGAARGGAAARPAPRRAGADPIDAAVARANKVESRRAGLAAGSERVSDATRALGAFATASDRAKAKVADLTAQVERNRREMASLREQALKTGDADGTLAARMQGLSVATGKASVELGAARRELRAVDGGLIDAVKSAANLSGRFDALRVAAGNLIAAGVSRGLDAVKSGIVGSAEAAMDFEKALVDVAKVAQDVDLTKEGLLDPRVKQGIKDVARELGVMPTEVAELTAQITAAFSGQTDIVALAGDVTKIGVAWDISGKQAGEFFKQTSAGLQLNADETKSLFGSINELGNKMGIQSSQIAEAMTRSAGVLKGANLSGETGAALNATLIKAGASAEVAATGVRTFIARLGVGEAATDKQIHAFEKLGMKAEDVAKELTSNNPVRAQKQIQAIVQAISELDTDKRITTLVELFGSESIGSIGAAATALDALTTSFEIAGNKAAALTSVQDEYDRVSDTSAMRVAKLKANVGVLAVELGDKLLPYIDRVANFLTSPEGQEWGARAAETAAKVVTGLADVIGQLANGLLIVTENLGATTAAIGLLAIAVGALLGPWGLLLTGAVALGSYLGGPFLEQMEAARASELLLAKSIVDGGERMRELVTDLQRHDGVFAKVSDRWRELMLRIMGATSALTEFYRRQDAEEVRAGKLAHEEAKRREVDRQRLEAAKRTQAAGEADAARRRAAAAGSRGMGGGRGPGGDLDTASFLSAKGRADLSGLDQASREQMFDQLSAKRVAGELLKPSEAKMLTALSKALDRPIPTKAASHKATEMDKRLAALDPSLAGVLRQGGEKDRGGDLKVSDDPLSRAVYARATGSGGGGGSGGLGPGPNITTHNYFTNINVTMPIDARSNAPVPENIASAARQAGQQVANVTFTGVQRVLTLKTSGGRMS